MRKGAVAVIAAGAAVAAGVVLSSRSAPPVTSPLSAAVRLPVVNEPAAAAAAAGQATAGHVSTTTLTSSWTHDGSTPLPRPRHVVAQALPRQLIVPDLIGVLPSGISKAQISAIAKLAGVRGLLVTDGGQITINGRPAGVLGVTPGAFRSWTPPQTAAKTSLWTGLQAGALVANAGAAAHLGLHAGKAYPAVAAIRTRLRLAGSAPLGVPGVDAVVDAQESRQLGLVKNVAVLINAPGDRLTSLAASVRSVLGAKGQVVRLVPLTTTGRLPVDSHVPAGRPTNYIDLFRASAAKYCPGLSWTVLAAIGEIESADGVNVGPSTAGALGPMQFMPTTWAIWGTVAFGETGPPNIMDPYDAVPAAARMLCANGGANGDAGLSQAIFDYNHADWYVAEVLDLAAEYAREYG